MPRSPRAWTHQDSGSYHLISRIPDGSRWLDDEEKEHFVRLLERLARGFFVDIHAFVVMSNHFHILATAREADAQLAGRAELLRRYQAVYGAGTEPPSGVRVADGSFEPDRDDGLARLRARLGSVSRFMQELKQSFTRWYNRRHDRCGYLWGDRFKGVLIAKAGDAELVCAAYIDLNPVRAAIVGRPEDYRWSSMGLRARSPRRAERLLVPLRRPELAPGSPGWYRVFVYEAGAIAVPGKRGRIPAKIRDEVIARCGELNVRARLRYRWRNLSEGIAVGTAGFVAGVQRRLRRKHVRPRAFAGPAPGERAGPLVQLFATRVLHPLPS